MNKMKMIFFMFLVLMSSLSFGNGSAEAENFFKVPDAVEIDEKQYEEFSQNQLDKGLLELLSIYEWGDDPLPEKFHGFKFDLNDDGRKEYFISLPVYSGTGGTYFIIVSFIDNKWKDIGDLQGNVYLLPVKNGWHPIVFIGRGGSEYYTKNLLEFSEGKYRKTWKERYDHGKITKEIIEPKDRPNR